MAGPVESSGQTWIMQISGTRLSPSSDRLTVCVDLDGEVSDQLRITLFWGEHTYLRVADPAGHVCFDDLAADVVQQPSPSIRVEVQVLDPSVPG